MTAERDPIARLIEDDIVLDIPPRNLAAVWHLVPRSSDPQAVLLVLHQVRSLLGRWTVTWGEDAWQMTVTVAPAGVSGSARLTHFVYVALTLELMTTAPRRVLEALPPFKNGLQQFEREIESTFISTRLTATAGNQAVGIRTLLAFIERQRDR